MTLRMAVTTSLALTLVLVSRASLADHFVDGDRRVEVERAGPARADALGRQLVPIRMRYPGRAPVAAEVDDRVIVTLDPGADTSGLHLVKPLMPSIGLWLAEAEGASSLAGSDGVALAGKLATPAARARGIRAAVPNLYLRLRPFAEPFTPNDPRFADQWFFENLGMTEAWGLSRGDAATKIVVIDSGCDGLHVDLVDKMDPGRDVIDQDDDPTPDPNFSGAAHGTECAGVAAASTNNGEGIAGACPDCRLSCVRMLQDASTPISANVEAFQFALDSGASIVSNSWGFVDAITVPQPLADAIDNVHVNGRGGKGALILFAAGNDDREIRDDELQALPSVLCIGAINNFDDQTPFTNRGGPVDLVTPTGTMTTDISGPGGDDPGDYTSLFGGTSSACPVAAGIAGLLVSAAPDATAVELYDVMIKTARKAPYAEPDASGHDPIFGYGIVDPTAALELVLGITEPPPSTGSGGGNDAPKGDSSCRMSPASPTAPPFWAYLLASLVALRRRRR